MEALEKGLYISIAGLFLASIVVSGSCFFLRKHEDAKCAQQVPPAEYKVTSGPINQVFRDYDGYRIYSQDKEGIILEEFVSSYQLPADPVWPEDIKRQFKGLEKRYSTLIYRDLEPGQVATASQVSYRMPNCKTIMGWDGNFKYTEVHLPKDMGLSPGHDEIIEAKIPRHIPMAEIK